MKIAMIIFLAAVLLGGPAASQIVLQDTYESTPVGFPPVNPQVGFVIQRVGSNAVFNWGVGNRALRSVSSSTGEGFLVNYGTTYLAISTTTNYQFLIEEGSNPEALNSFNQHFTLRPLGTNFMLYWGYDHRLRIAITSATQDRLFPTSFLWDFETVYDVVVHINGGTGANFSIIINGENILTEEPIDGFVEGLKYLAFSCNYPTTGSQIVDEIVVYDGMVVKEEASTWGEVKALYR